MVKWDIVQKLMAAFPNSLINGNGEFIAHQEANEYFILRTCETELDVKCKVLEWFSRAAYKSQPFGQHKNKLFHAFMLNGINQFLETEFTTDDIDHIYTYLGNAINHAKTVRFVESGYDMAALEWTEARNMRLIDADALKKTLDGTGCLYSIIHMIIGNQPTINPIHEAGGCYCQECCFGRTPHAEDMRDGYVYCWQQSKYKEIDDFCSDGEPREVQDNG